MATNDERREVAARLREQKTWDIFTDFEYCIGDLCAAVFEDDGDLNNMFRLQAAFADLIEPEERTCRIEGTYSDEFAIYDHLTCGHVNLRHWHEPTSYCSICGAKVVKE